MNQAEDVEVILGHDRRYKFHSGTLARNSTLFAEMLTEANAAKLNSRARQVGITIRWMIELTRLPTEDFPAGILQLVDLTPTGERVDGRTGMIVNENGRIPMAHKVFDSYEAVFYAFYNKELKIDDTDMSAALSECYQLIEISNYLGCTSLIGKPIEVALFKHGQDFFRAIQNKPYAWITMANRIRSEMIFRECMIHLVGSWKMIRTQPGINESIRQVPRLRGLIEKYQRVLMHQGKNLEHSVMTKYPGNINIPDDELPIKREAYTKDILIWLALTMFRHWLSDRLIVNEKGRQAPDCGYELYRQLGTAGDAYMNKTVVNQFHTKFPMTKKAMNVAENHLEEIKLCIKNIVTANGILKSNCQLDTHRWPVKYLTCTDFKSEDLPWVAQDRIPLPATPKKLEYKPGGNEIARRNLETAKRYHESGGLTFDQEDDDDEELVDAEEMGEQPMKRLRAD